MSESTMVNMGKEANAGFTRDDSKTVTRLLDKNWSPLLVRKTMVEGWPLFCACICDANLNDLDQVIYDLTDQAKQNGFLDGSIQGIRNYCGFLSDGMVKHYNSIKRGCMEGLLILYCCDKCVCDSAYGDAMVHNKCLNEIMFIINTMPHI
jgi:hypothetical protein